MMRKYIIGGLVGFLLAVPFTAFGEQISTVIGKQVKSEHAVLVDGKQLDKKAILIDGTTYAPLRAVADAVGYDAAFTNNTVVLSNPSAEGELMTTEPPVTLPTGEYYYTLDTIDEAIAGKTGDVDTTKVMIATSEARGYTEKVEELKGLLLKKEQELSRLQAIKAELEAQP